MSDGLPRINGDVHEDMEVSEQRHTPESLAVLVMAHHRETVAMHKLQQGAIQTLSTRVLQMHEAIKKAANAPGQTQLIIVPQAVPIWIAAAMFLGIFMALVVRR